jgi:hypothetical protein
VGGLRGYYSSEINERRLLENVNEYQQLLPGGGHILLRVWLPMASANCGAFHRVHHYLSYGVHATEFHHTNYHYSTSRSICSQQSLPSLCAFLRLKSPPRWRSHNARHSLFHAHIVVPTGAFITTFASLRKCLGSFPTLSWINLWHVETRHDRYQSSTDFGSLFTTRNQVESPVEKECRGRARP